MRERDSTYKDYTNGVRSILRVEFIKQLWILLWVINLKEVPEHGECGSDDRYYNSIEYYREGF